ncbi:hypothetical protein D3C84_718020 [compost metagenome]
MAEAFFRLRTFPTSLQAVMHFDCACARAPAHIRTVVLDVAHALDAARHDYVSHPGLYHHRGAQYGLQATTAAPVKLHAGHFNRQPCLQADPAPHARGFAVGVRLRKDDIVDARRIQPAFAQYGIDDMGPQYLHGKRSQAASKGANGGSQWGDNCCTSHVLLLLPATGWRRLV